jgi:DNA-binding transcriptional LysR family regulator
MNLHQLKLFCAVVERGSFTMASQRLHITQPALSIQIRRLEETLHSNLFERTKKGLMLTDAGRIVYDSAKAIFEREEGMQRRLREIQSGETGTIVLAVTSTGVLYFFSSLIQAFRREFPTIKIISKLCKRDEIPNLVAERLVHMGFEWGPVNDARVSVTILGQVQFFAILNPENPLSARKMISVTDFTHEAFIDLDHGPGASSFFEESLWRAGIRHPVVVRVPSIDAIKRLIEANLGVGVLSKLSVERELKLGFLKAKPLEGFQLARDLVIISNKGGLNSAPARSLFEFSRNASFLPLGKVRSS